MKNDPCGIDSRSFHISWGRGSTLDRLGPRPPCLGCLEGELPALLGRQGSHARLATLEAASTAQGDSGGVLAGEALLGKLLDPLYDPAGHLVCIAHLAEPENLPLTRTLWHATHGATVVEGRQGGPVQNESLPAGTSAATYTAGSAEQLRPM